MHFLWFPLISFVWSLVVNNAESELLGAVSLAVLFSNKHRKKLLTKKKLGVVIWSYQEIFQDEGTPQDRKWANDSKVNDSSEYQKVSELSSNCSLIWILSSSVELLFKKKPEEGKLFFIVYLEVYILSLNLCCN